MNDRCDRCGRRTPGRGAHTCAPVDTDAAAAVRRIDASLAELRRAADGADTLLGRKARAAADRIDHAVAVLHVAAARSAGR